MYLCLLSYKDIFPVLLLSWFVVLSGGLDQLIKIVEQPQDYKIKLKEKDFTIKLRCHAESPSGHQLSYAWYYLNASEKPGKFKKDKKTIKGTRPCLELPMQFSPNMDERRYCCEVSAAGHSEWSRVAVVELLHCKLLKLVHREVRTCAHVNLECLKLPHENVL